MKSYGIAQKILAWAAAAVLLFQMAAPVRVFAGEPAGPDESAAMESPVSQPDESDEDSPAGQPGAGDEADPDSLPGEDGETGADSAPDEAEDEAAGDTADTAGDGEDADVPPPVDEPVYDLALAADAVAEDGGNAFELVGLTVQGGDDLDPTGARENARPYGDVHVIPSNDIFVFGSPDGNPTASPAYNLFGVKDPAVPASLADLSLAEQAKKNAATTKGGTLATAFGARSAVAAVAFNPTSDESNYMRRSATAMLAATNADSSHAISGPLVFAVTGQLDNGTPTVYKIAEFPYKNGDEKTTDGWSLDNKSIQEELYIEALDLDGDGVDEIAFLLPGAEAGGHSRLVIYKQKNPAGDVTSKDNWVAIYNEGVTGIRMGQSKPSDARRYRTHSLAVGDLNGDGLDDIAVVGTTTTSYLSKSNRSKDYTVSRLEVLYTTKAEAKAGGYACTRMTYAYDSASSAAADNTLFGSGSGALMPLPTAASISLAKSSTDQSQFNFKPDDGSVKAYPIQLGVTIGDSDGDGKNELLLGYNMMGFFAFDGDMYWCNAISYAVERLVPDDGGNLQRSAASNGNAIVQVNINDVAGAYGALKGSEKVKLGFFFGGKSKPARETESMYKNTGAVRLAVAQMVGPGAPASIIVSGNQHDPADAGSPDRYTVVASEAARTMWSQMREAESLLSGSTGQVTHTAALWASFPGGLANGSEYYTLRPGAISTGDGIAYGYLLHHLIVDSETGGHDFVSFVSNNTTPMLDATVFGSEFHRYAPCAAALPCIDNDFVLLEYLEHQYSYTDPTVVAALAAQPYYQDLADYYGATTGETSYGTYWGVGHGTSSNATTSFGAYLSTSAELGTKYAKAIVEAEVEYNHSYATEQEHIVTQTEMQSFATNGEDSVVLITYPVDRYIYKMTTFDETYQNTVTNDYTMTVPYQPVSIMATMEAYNKLYALYPDSLPDIDGEVFTHTQGVPGSYAGVPGKYATSALESKGLNGTNTSMNQTTSAEISIDNSYTGSTVTSNSVNFSIGGGAQVGYEGAVAVANVKVTAGATGGHEWGNGTISTQTKGVTYKGGVGGTGNTDRYSFNWKMVQYNYASDDGRFGFPVVTYKVEGEKSTVTLPERFEVDHNSTTHNAVALRWSPSKEDTSPGAGSKVVYQVARLKVDGNKELYDGPAYAAAYDEGTGLYSLTIQGLFPATSYAFELTCRLDTETTKSVPTPPVQAVTNPDTAVYKFTTQPLKTDLAAGVAGTLSAVFSQGEKATYRWEKLVGGVWRPLEDSSGSVDGIHSQTLQFKTPKASHTGQYRLSATIKYTGGEKTFYSDAAELTVKKQNATLTLSGVELLLPQGVTKVTPSVTIAPAEDMQLASGTKVVFVLTHADGDIEMQSEKVTSPAGGTVKATALRLPKSGEYTLDAYYVGDSIHAQSHAAEPLTFVRLSGMGGSSYIAPTYGWKKTIEYGWGFAPTVTYYYSEESSIKTKHVRVPHDVQVVRCSDGEPMTDWVELREISGLEPYTYAGFWALGEYQVTVTHGGATTSQIVMVTPNNVTFTVTGVTRRAEVDTISPSDIKWRRSSGGTPDAAINTALDTAFDEVLGVFDSAGTPVTLSASTPPGVYSIRLPDNEDFSAGFPRFNITVVPATYTILSNRMQIFYGAENTRYGTVAATAEGGAALASGGIVPYGKKVTFTAAPVPGYKLAGWQVAVNGTSKEVAATGASHTLTATGDCDVRARFEVDSPVKGVTITYPEGALAVNKDAYSKVFTAEVAGGATGKVSWSFAGGPAPAGSSLQALTGNTCQFMLPAAFPGETVKLRATSVDDSGFYDEVEIALTADPVEKRVLGVTLSPRQDSIKAGERFNFEAQVLAEGGADTAVKFDITGAKAIHPTGSAAAVGTTTCGVTAGDIPGTVITIKATSEFDDEKYDTISLVVVPAEETPVDSGQAEDIRLAMDHVVLEAGSTEPLRISLICRSSAILPGKPSIYKVLTDRQAPAGSEAPTATLGAAQNAIYVDAGSAKAGDAFVVRVPVAGNPASWAECRVDIAPAAPAKMEPRTVAKEVTAYAYSTGDILIGLARTNLDAHDPWTLRSPKLKVTLAKDTHKDLLAAFEEELEVVDDGHLRLVPAGPGSMEKLKSSYGKVALALVDTGTGEPIQDVLMGTFTLKINKSLPKITAGKIVLDTWGGSASAAPVFKGGVVTGFGVTLSGKVSKWLSRSAGGAYFVAEQNASGSATLTMNATVAGWSKPVRVKINVTATGSAPGLKLKSASVKLYQDPALSTGVAMTLQTRKSADTLAGLEVSGITVHPDYEGSYKATPAANFETSGNFTLSAKEKIAKKATIKLRVSFGGSRASRTHDLAVTVNPVTATPKLKLARTSVTLNAAYGESTTIPIASTVADYDLKNLNLTVATSTNPANVPLPQVTGLATGNPVLKVMSGSNAIAGKTSKFVLSLWAKPYSTAAGGAEEPGQKLVHKVTVSVKAADKAAKVKLTAKGKLDVSLAEPAPVRVTAKLDGHLGTFDAGLDNVKLAIYRKVGSRYEMVYDGTAATTAQPNFRVARTGANSMEWLISPAERGAIEPGSYRVGVAEGTVAGEKVYTLPKGANNPSGNYTAFTVTASKPKVTISPTAGVLHRNDGFTEQAFKISLPAGSGAISEVKLSGAGTDGMYFELKDLKNGHVVIHFREPFQVTKKGKTTTIDPTLSARATTTLTLQVYIKGGSTTKPATTVKVKVAAT